MSKLKKRIILICVVLALLLTGTVAMFALAVETVPMPVNSGLARMRQDIYEMYKAGKISAEVFEEYSRSFEINRDVDVRLGDSRYGNTVKITKQPKSQGTTQTTVEFGDFGTMDVRLYGSAAYNEEMVNNFDLLQSFHLQTHSFGYGYYRMKMGTNYQCNDILPYVGVYTNERYEMILPGRKLEHGGIYNGEYVWDLCTDGYATASQFSYKLLDHGIAGTNGWTARLEESGENTADGKTIYQLLLTDNGGDQFRPANENITKEDLATLQLMVQMKSTDTLNKGKTYSIPAKAVGIREKYTDTKGHPSAIVFEFYGEKWLEMEDQVSITGIETVQVLPEGETAVSYDIYDIYADVDLTKEFKLTSSTPVTDFAGNEISWKGTSVSMDGTMSMDRKEAVVVGVELDFSNFTSAEGSTEANFEESFTGPYDYVFWPTLIMNEEMYKNPEAVGKVAIQFNLRDEKGEPVISVLERSYNFTNRDGIVYTELVFDNVYITEGMTPQGEQIVIEKVINEHLLQDRVGNINLSNDILMTGVKETSVWPEQISYLDTKAPVVSVQPAVVNEKKSTDDKVDAVYITVPFQVSDYKPEDADDGFMCATASGTTGQLWMSNPVDGRQIQYKYTVSQNPKFDEVKADSSVEWLTGNLGSAKHTSYSDFGVGADGKNLYLHMELSNLANYEISKEEGLKFSLYVQDMAKNRALIKDQKIEFKGLVDNVGPTMSLHSPKIEVSSIGDSVTFSAKVDCSDINGISSIEYAFVDPDKLDSDAGRTYTPVDIEDGFPGKYACTVTGEFTPTDATDKLVNKVLVVVVRDQSNNPTERQLEFSADLNKVISNYALTEDIFVPSLQTGIQISEPFFNGTLEDTASTRVTVVVPTKDESGVLGEDIYFRVIPSAGLTTPVQVLDPQATWYKVGSYAYHDTLHYYIYRNITKEDAGAPGWVNHYGDMDVYIASSNLAMDTIKTDDATGGVDYGQFLILEPGYASGSETDTTYSWSKIGTVAYAGNVNGAYDASYSTDDQGRIIVADPTGKDITGYFVNGSGSGDRYVKLNQTIAGTRVRVKFDNQTVSTWGAEGIDFANSYAVLVRANSDGSIADEQGNYDEVTGHLYLSNSLEQELTVPDAPLEGESYTSGVYTWVIHLAQKGGGSSDFAVGDFENGDLYLILDDAQVPEKFGVLQHTNTIHVTQDGKPDAYETGHTIELVQTPNEGESKLSVLNIGIAKPSDFLHEIQDLDIVKVDGYPAYRKAYTNAADPDEAAKHTASFRITADMTESGYGTYLGQEIGNVAGIRVWNKANVVDPSKLEFFGTNGYKDDARGIKVSFSKANGVATLDVAFNVAWYINGANPLYASEAEMIAGMPTNSEGQPQNGKLAFMVGENTICYQLKMENGKLSPVYQFTLNLVKTTPQVNVEFTRGPGSIAYYTENPGEVGDPYLSIDYAELRFEDLFSEYSGLSVYHVEFVDQYYPNNGNISEGGYYALHKLTQAEMTDGYRIHKGASGINRNVSTPAPEMENVGYYGTSVNGTFDGTSGVDGFFIITDNTGNAVTIYPLDHGAFGQSFERFLPDKMEYMDGVVNGMHSVRFTYAALDYYTNYYHPDYADRSASLDRTESVQFRIYESGTQEEKDGLWATYLPGNEEEDGFVELPNASGMAEVGYGTIGFVPPYHPDEPIGTTVDYVVEGRLLDGVDAQGEPIVIFEGTDTFSAPNTKPAVTKVVSKPGCIVVTYNVPVNTDEGASNVACISVDASVYGKTYTHTFVDLYGNEYTEDIEVRSLDTDPTVVYEYQGEINERGYTTSPVKVTITSEKEIYINNNTLEAASDFVQVTGNGTTQIVLTVSGAFEAPVYYYTDKSFAAYVKVDNVVKTDEVAPYIGWDYGVRDIADGNVVYRDVTAFLLDRNGQALLDPATGLPAQFTFYPGGPTEYTFTGCVSELTNTAVPDMTAKLTVTLQPAPIEEKDTLAPDVDIVAYLSDATGAQPAKMVYRQSSGRFAMTEYAFRYGLTDEEVYYSDMDKLIANMGWSQSYMFHVDLHDESRVKVIIKDSIYESGITYNSTSDTIEGVNLVGRTLQITKNCEFALYIVDEAGNMCAVHFKVSNLSAAPVPELQQVESRTADDAPAIRVYLLPPQINNYQNLKITNLDKKTDLDKYDNMESDYYTLDYILCEKSGSYEVAYSYEVSGKVFTGTLTANVTVPKVIKPAVTKTLWSANYFNQSTNRDISLHLYLDNPVKAASVVYTVDGQDNRIATDTINEYGLYVTAFEDDVSIVYEKNTADLLKMLADRHGEGTLRLMMTEKEYGGVGYYNIPQVKTIDRTAPVLVDEPVITYPENDLGLVDYKTALITLELDETALNHEGNQKGTQFQYKVRKNDTYTYRFVDEAGNASSIDVVVSDLITEELMITLSTSASDADIITNPEKYEAKIGQTLYAKTNRDATIYIYGKGSEETVSTVAKDTWTAVTVTENSMGMHPSVVARDNFGNLAIVQLEYIPIRDINAPAAFLHRDLVSVSALASEDEIHEELMANLFYSDDVTAKKDIAVTIEYDKISSGKTVATYTLKDEEGNTTVRQCWLRIRNGLEPVIHVNGQLVEDGAFLYVTDGYDLDITVAFDGNVAEPYKLVYEEGDLRTWAKMKDGVWLTAGYDDPVSQTYQVQDLGDGWYSFALTTQGMEVYFFQVHLGRIG